MHLRCPVCGKRTIGVFTVFLHWGGRGRNRVNRFRCTDCDAPLKCYFQLPLFMLCGVILQLLVTSSSPASMLIGSLLFSGIAFLFYPIRRDEELSASAHSSLASGKPFDTPADQGWYKLESTLLAGAAFFVWWSLLLHLTTWLGWGGLGLMIFFPGLTPGSGRCGSLHRCRIPCWPHSLDAALAFRCRRAGTVSDAGIVPLENR